MELALWRWSTTVQLTSLVIVTLFFWALARRLKLAEVRFWALAWTCNLAALAVTLLFWYLQDPRLFGFVRVSYTAAKTAFVILLIQGAWALKRPGQRLFPLTPTLVAIAVYATLMGVFVGTVNRLGVLQHSAMALLLLASGILLLKAPRESGMAWLVAGFIARGLLAAIEATAYGSQLLPAGALSPEQQSQAAIFLSAHSSFDSGAEWLLSLGSVLALSERAQRELRRINSELLSAQDNLRRLVDRDPLTALANRRALPEVFRAVQPQGATLLFFDLDGFKQINDLHGHQVGDDHLKRFATALGESFRPGDAIIRYAGDEFLVVASGLERSALDGRVEHLRERLKFEHGVAGRIKFSVGLAELPPGGQPDAALAADDEAMYRAKTARTKTA